MSTPTSSSLGKDAWYRLLANKMAMASLILLLLISILCMLGPLLSSHSFDQQNLDEVFQAPSFAHPFGTDNLGRDLFARTTYGGRISLMVGLLATLVSLLIGVTYGMVSGYVGGRLDAWMMRFVDDAFCGCIVLPSLYHICHFTDGPVWSKFPTFVSRDWSS